MLKIVAVLNKPQYQTKTKIPGSLFRPVASGDDDDGASESDRRFDPPSVSVDVTELPSPVLSSLDVDGLDDAAAEVPVVSCGQFGMSAQEVAASENLDINV
jgi:hypothetical protein